MEFCLFHGVFYFPPTPKFLYISYFIKKSQKILHNNLYKKRNALGVLFFQFEKWRQRRFVIEEQSDERAAVVGIFLEAREWAGWERMIMSEWPDGAGGPFEV